MNQILSTENINNRNKNSKKSKGNSGAKDVNSVIKFFAIVLMIFGIFIVVNSSYAMIKGNGGNQTKELIEPTIEVENKGEDKALLKIMHEDIIDTVIYSWNNENPTTAKDVNTKFYQKEIDIPNGINTLYVTATDVNGATKKFQRVFELNTNTKIDLSISGNNIKINIEGKEKIEKFEYSWDEEQPTTVKVDDNSYSMEIEAPIGRHTLIVKATDVNGEEQEKKQEVVGTTQPTIEIGKGTDAYIIKAHDEIGLDRIEITTLDDGKVTPIRSDGKDFEYSYPLKPSNDNFIEIVAYNENGVKSKRLRAKWPKQ